jgi:transposase
MRCFEHPFGHLNKTMKTKSETTNHPAFFLGIDVGKADLFCHLIGPGEVFSDRFDNTTKGIKSLLAWLSKITYSRTFAACLEQTGHYGDATAQALHDTQSSGIYQVNPQRIKAFGMQKLRRNKSDTADAKLIARFIKSEHLELRPWQPKSSDQQRITALSRYADSLTQDAARCKTMLESQTEKTIIACLKRQIKAAQKEITALRSAIAKLIKEDSQLQTKSKLIKSIPGLGPISTQIVIAELPDLDQFDDARQLAAWAGLTPRHHSSGTSGKTQTPITKIGSIHLRRGLFMPAMTARVFNPLLKEFGDRLKTNGKSPKQIIVAIMRKLLHQIYGILKSGLPYNPNKRGFQNAFAIPLKAPIKNATSARVKSMQEFEVR